MIDKLRAGLGQWIYHLRFGLQSGIPLCCILYFIFWHNKTQSSSVVFKDNGIPDSDHNKYAYAICPHCVRNKKIVAIKRGKYKPSKILFRLETWWYDFFDCKNCGLRVQRIQMVIVKNKQVCIFCH